MKKIVFIAVFVITGILFTSDLFSNQTKDAAETAGRTTALTQENFNRLIQRIELLEAAVKACATPQTDCKTGVCPPTTFPLFPDITVELTNEDMVPEKKDTPTTYFRKWFDYPVGTKIPCGKNSIFGYFKVSRLYDSTFLEWHYKWLNGYPNRPERLGINADLRALPYPELHIIMENYFGPLWGNSFDPGDLSGIQITGLPAKFSICERKVDRRKEGAPSKALLRELYQAL